MLTIVYFKGTKVGKSTLFNFFIGYILVQKGDMYVCINSG